MTTLVCEKKDIDSGQFKIDELKRFTLNTGARILIRGYGEVMAGELKLLN
jgi:hypothetical protein